MPASFDADLELLWATAQRHAGTLPPRTSLHLSKAIGVLTDPLVPPRLAGVDQAETADLRGAVQGVRDRLQRLAQQGSDPRQILAMAMAARELTGALATLNPPWAAQATEPGDWPGRVEQ